VTHQCCDPKAASGSRETVSARRQYGPRLRVEQNKSYVADLLALRSVSAWKPQYTTLALCTGLHPTAAS